MLIIGSTVVVAAGTPGPILGDGVNTICTIIVPRSAGNPGAAPVSGVGGLTVVSDSTTVGARRSAINQAGPPRVNYAVSRFQAGGASGNANSVYYGGLGCPNAASTNKSSIELQAGAYFPAVGNGVTAVVDLADIDINADASADAVIWIAEVD